MLKKILGYKTSSATLGDNHRLVLSLEDALTPAMWIIDLNASPSLLFKVTESDDGLFALQKLSGGTAEDLAFYKKKSCAINAMNKACTAMNAHHETRPFMRFIRALIGAVGLLVILIALFILLRLDVVFINWLNNSNAAGTEIVQQTTPAPLTSDNTNDVGVPLSADDFFDQKPSRSSGLPF